MTERPNHYPSCGDCAECLAKTHRLLAERVGRPARPRPTAAQLEKHAARFGPDQVVETAAELGVDGVTVGPPPRGRRIRRRKR